MNRICIIGCSGSGKSTLARRLATALDLPFHSLDRLYWKPGWVPQDDTLWFQQHQSLISGDCWIIEGTYLNTLKGRLARADMAIYLDLPRHISFPRVLRRTVRWWRQLRPDAPDGCPERFDWDFFHYVWTFRRGCHARITDLLAGHRLSCRVLVATSSREVDEIFATLTAERKS